MTAAPQLELTLGRRDGQSGGRTTGGQLDRRSGGQVIELPTLLAPERLAARLREAGLSASIAIETHANRRTLVSFTSRGALRVHLGFAMAPDPVIAAIARWARPKLRRAERLAAARVLTSFPVHQHVPAVRPLRRVREPARPGDAVVLSRLMALHQELNARHFAGGLGPATLLLSSRMRRRLGEFRPPHEKGAHARPEIIISRRHLRRDGWSGVRETLAHELVHQWQLETGRPLGHDAEFRARCDAIGIDRRATRRLRNDLG